MIAKEQAAKFILIKTVFLSGKDISLADIKFLERIGAM